MLSDIKVKELACFLTSEVARTPLKFGAVVVETVDLLKVRATVETRSGKIAEGWGAIFLMDFWGWPDAALSHETKAAAMLQISKGFGDLVLQYPHHAHPIDLFHDLEPDLHTLNLHVCAKHNLSPAQPFLGALVCASPIDAAIHDAFGIANGIDTYQGYNADFMSHDLSKWLGANFTEKYPGDYIRPIYQEKIPVFHLCGGLDKLYSSEVDETDPTDGLPNSLEEWIAYEGLYCLKIKLRGTDIEWDLQRTLAVYEIACKQLAKRHDQRLHITLDTNEQCESPSYIEELLCKIREISKACYDTILYIEQPTERDLTLSRHDMRALSALKPVIVDESLVDIASMELALDLGWSGIALKSCKCQSADAVFWSKASELGIAYSVQDLTNPSLALLHSVGLAARLTTILGVEANSRQFFPTSTQLSEKSLHKGIFHLVNGEADTGSLQGSGLGFNMLQLSQLGWSPGPQV